MRKLMWFTIGFALSCGLCAYALPAESLKTGILVSFGATCVLGIVGNRFTFYRRPALILLGCTLGVCWYGFFQQEYLSIPASMDGKTETVTIRTTDFSRETDYGFSVEGRLTLDGKNYPVRVYLDDGEALLPGALITGPFRFRVTAPVETPVSYLSGESVFLVARQEDEIAVTTDPETSWQDRIACLRQWLKDALKACFPEEAFSFAQALLLGDTSEIDYETDTDFKVSGIRHVIAVSGLHVSILVALLSAVTFRKRFLTVPVGLAVLFAFACLAGFSPSVSRACLMSGLMLLGLLFNREYDGATALSFAVLTMLLGNPLVIGSVSFQLSVASVGGIFLLDPRLRPWLTELLPDPVGVKWKQRLVRWFSTSVSVSLSAMFFTTPLCAYYFGMVSLVGVMTNLLALWVVSGIFYGIMLVCLVYGLWMPGAVVLGKIVAWPIRYVLGVAHIMAEIPLAAVYTESIYIVFWLIFVYILLIVFFFSRYKKVKQLLCCGVLGLCVALLASWAEPADTAVAVLDVGQGQCIVLQSAGKTWMVDCGGDLDSETADLAAAYLLSRGITRLDGLILTHLDRDHAGAAEYLMARIDTELLILPAEYSTIRAENTVYASQNLCMNFGNTDISIFAPTFPGTGNEKSLCVLFDTEKCDILITGDRDGFGERRLLRNAKIPDVDVLIAGHHGSKNSTCEELLHAVSPEIVCISAGKNNPFGHPAPELLRRLAEFGCAVYRTDLHGTVTIRR